MPVIHVHGVGVRSPFGAGVATLLDALESGACAIGPHPAFAEAGLRYPVAAPVPDTSLADAGVEPWWDRSTRLLWAAVSDALVDACGSTAITCLGVPAHRVALISGTSCSGIGRLGQALREGKPPEHEDATYFASTHAVATQLGVLGPVLVVGAVCASGALAIAQAAELLADGVVDLAIAAGFDPLEPFVGLGFDTLGALSDAPRPFRAGRRGLVLGEGAAALVLSLHPGGARRGVIAGWGSSMDAHHLTAPHPQGEGVVLAIERALACAGLEPEAVGVINAHGTGTQFNDAMESAAFCRVWGARAGGRLVHTVKGAIGHTLGAAGAIEAVVALESLTRGKVPPTVTSGEPDPSCDIELVAGEPRVSDSAAVVSISAGFGGINGALILTKDSLGAAPAIAEERQVVIRASAVWVAGRWISSLEELALERSGIDEVIDLGMLASSRRLQRADRVTRIGAMAAARALAGLEPQARTSVATASALATAFTNEAWERRRIDKGRPDPRVFAYTATTALAGEVAIALEARGPSIALLGGPEASLAALDRARSWVASGQCDRAIVIACECPAEGPALTAAPAVACSAAVVLEASTQGAGLRLRWRAPDPSERPASSLLLSVEPLARIALATSPCTVTARAAVGSWIDAILEPRA